MYGGPRGPRAPSPMVSPAVTQRVISLSEELKQVPSREYIIRQFEERSRLQDELIVALLDENAELKARLRLPAYGRSDAYAPPRGGGSLPPYPRESPPDPYSQFPQDMFDGLEDYGSEASYLPPQMQRPAPPGSGPQKNVKLMQIVDGDLFGHADIMVRAMTGRLRDVCGMGDNRLPSLPVGLVFHRPMGPGEKVDPEHLMTLRQQVFLMAREEKMNVGLLLVFNTRQTAKLHEAYVDQRVGGAFNVIVDVVINEEDLDLQIPQNRKSLLSVVEWIMRLAMEKPKDNTPNWTL